MSSTKQTIWQLVQRCAEDLTRRGITPFTRGELIKCIQSTHPQYGPDSINPIIQGVTDNSRGGAPGAVGKDILHRVDRGLYVLKGRIQSGSPVKTGQPYVKTTLAVGRSAPLLQGKELTKFEGVPFTLICKIEPERVDLGRIREFHPQDRYQNTDNLRLNKYGKGPFCKFKIPRNLNLCGVYVIAVDGAPKYVGECENLSSRYNMGYGNISPRNCFVGGQETNCRINTLIGKEALEGNEITLWFHQTEDYKTLEESLRVSMQPEWNRA